MDQTSTKFIDKDWDDKYELSTLHLSFMIQTLFPVHIIKWGSTRRHYDNIAAKLKPFEDDITTFVVTGSIAEGYSIPPSISRSYTGKTPEAEILSDVDTLWVSEQMKISTVEDFDASLTDYKGYFEYKKKSPGYVRICLPSTREKDETFIYDDTTGKCYLSGTKFTDKMFALFWDRKDVFKQGPAISMIDQLSTDSAFYVPEGISKDLVLALPCYPWPTVADGWRKRVEGSSWLCSDVKDGIVKDGCHVVAVPSKNTEFPEFEWRISFSASEGKLAQEAVTDYQRQCFIYLKILHHQKTKPRGILSSYMFKSVFLYCCEHLPVHYWKEYPGSCVLYMLDVMINCLHKRYIPTYFLPDNNLIGHLTDDNIQQAIQDVENIRQDPISPVLDFTDGRLFSHQPIYLTFREMVEPLLSDMKTFKDHKNREQAIVQGMIATGYRICNFLVAEESSSEEAALFKHQEGVRCLINIYNLWLQPMNIDASLSKYIYQAGITLKDPHLRLVYLDAVVSLENEYPEFAELKKDIAIHFHKSACTMDTTATRRRWYMMRAEQIMKQIYEGHGDNVLDYAMFLLSENRFHQTKEMLEGHITKHASDDTEAMVTVTFGSEDVFRLVDSLKAYVETHGKIEGNEVAFAYYFLVYALKSERSWEYMSKLATVMEMFEDFKNKRGESAELLFTLAKDMASNVDESTFSSMLGKCILF